jgi:hypothetical protein
MESMGFNIASANNWLLIASRVAEDFDDDWLIFKSGLARWACIRRTANKEAKHMTTRVTTIALMCKDLAANRVAYSFSRNYA